MQARPVRAPDPGPRFGPNDQHWTFGEFELRPQNPDGPDRPGCIFYHIHTKRMWGEPMRVAFGAYSAKISPDTKIDDDGEHGANVDPFELLVFAERMAADLRAAIKAEGLTPPKNKAEHGTASPQS